MYLKFNVCNFALDLSIFGILPLRTQRMRFGIRSFRPIPAYILKSNLAQRAVAMGCELIQGATWDMSESPGNLSKEIATQRYKVQMP